jgi:PAS domain S-box-containing protein
MDLERQPLTSPAPGFIVAAASIVAATLVRWLLDPALGDTLPYITYFAAIMFVAWYSGLWPSVAAVLLGWLAAEFFFVAPLYQWTLHTGDIRRQVGTAAYFVVAIAAIVICEAMRSAQRRATARGELLRVTLASVGDAIITTDPHGRIAFLNAVAEALTGWSQAEAARRPLAAVFRIINDQTREPVVNPVARALREGVVVGLANHTVLVAKDGTERPIDDSAAPIRDATGKLVGCVLIFRDISQRKRAEAELRASESRKASILRAALDAIITIDGEGTIVEFNPAAEALFGYTEAEALGQEMCTLIIPVDLQEKHRAGMARFVAGGEGPALNKRLEMPARRKDGSALTVELTISPLETGGGVLFSGFMRDITEHNRAADAIRVSEERFRSLVHATTSIVWTSNAAGEFTSPQSSWSAYTGQSRDEYQGWGWTNAIHADDRDRVWQLGKASRATGTLFKADARMWHAASGAYRHFEAHGVPVYAADGSVREWVGMCADVEDQRQAEKKVYDLMAELREADRRKDEFLATLAHELRGPLAPLRNMLEVMKRTDGDAAMRSRARVTMERQLGQMVRLIDDLLDVSRISRGKIELRRSQVELAPIIQQAVEACRPAFETANHELNITLPQQPIYLDGDAVRLTQVVGNLLNNACKYSEPGGRIALKAEQHDGDVMLSVKDSGMGITPELLPAIFDMFAQGDQSTQQSQGGLGIGLTLVKRLVEMHGGSVQAFSAGKGQGSEFVVSLPSLAQAPQPVAEPAAKRELAPQPRRFLVVDDNADSAHSLSMLLQLSGNETSTAYDGIEAVQVAESFRPDIVLLDIGLPKMSGHDAARRIRAQPWGQNMVLIALTGWGQEEDRRKSKEAGFDHHMVKPVDYSALMTLLAGLPRS